jgi:hypothetical protein
MAIPALDPANTARWRLVYTCGGFQHAWGMRVDATNPSQSTVEQGYTLLLQDLSTLLFTITFVRLEFAAVGSSIFNPVTTTLTGTLAGTGAPGLEQATRQISWTGRGITGRKTRVFLWGYKDDLLDNMRITPAETAEVGTAINRINGYLHLFVGIDSIKPVYNQYVNVNYNKHWTKQARKS